MERNDREVYLLIDFRIITNQYFNCQNLNFPLKVHPEILVRNQISHQLFLLSKSHVAHGN